MDLYFSSEEVAQLEGAAERILRLIGYAEGRAESYAARRDDFKIIEFTKQKEERQKQNNNIALKSALYFTKKEISKMPTEFQKIFTIQLPVYVRQKKNGTFEARFRKFGFNVSVSSADYDKLKGKFLASLTHQVPLISAELPEETTKSPLFSEVAMRWLKLKRPNIKANTAEYYESLFNANILPAFQGRELQDIRQSDVLTVINGYVQEGKPRTATKIFQTMKAIFDFAVGDDLLEKSPMRLLRPPKYEEKNGCALSYDEEHEFLELLAASSCIETVKSALIVLLYTGMRRSELAGARIENGFISVICSKVRKGFQERRRLIPITPMLAQRCPELNLDEIRTVRPDALTQAFKRLMPSHHLHELRHTFITRCQECGVPREVVSVWAGHAADNTQTSNVYTHFSAEFMLKEAQKVIYK